MSRLNNVRKGRGWAETCNIRGMNRNTSDLEAIIRNRICRICSDRTAEGDCGREDPSSCALFRLFPQVALAIQSVNSNDIRDYIQAIRGGVCSICQDQSGGSCETREQVRCSLDAYLIPVVEAIEEATGRTFDIDVIRAPAVTVHLGA